MTLRLFQEALEILKDVQGAPAPEQGLGPYARLQNTYLSAYPFLAPEQRRAAAVGVQADSYAFGVLAYFLLTGLFPEGVCEMPSKKCPEYTYNWDHLLTTCLHPDPHRRPVKLVPLLEAIQLTAPVEQTSAPRPAQECVREEGQGVEGVKAQLLAATPSIKELRIEVGVATEPMLFTKVHASSSDVRYLEKETAGYTPSANNIESESSSYGVVPQPLVTHYQPQKKDARLIAPLHTEGVRIRGGQLWRGSQEGNRDEMPAHQVWVDDFEMDIHPVTNEQFVRFLEYMGGEKDAHYNDLIRLKDARINRSAGKLSIESGYAHHPVVGVTWYGAAAYAKWVDKRLPYETEWEIAARGRPEPMVYPTGDTIEKGQANFFSFDTTPVMSFPPNGYGLYDMVGNVYEWCQDWYSYNYYDTSLQEPHNPKGPPQGVYRVLRGGCWKSLKADLRCSHRHRNNPGAVNSTYGFRCAASII